MSPSPESNATTIRKGYVDTPGGQIHYREAGQARGLPIVMIHQTASCGVMYEWLMRELAGEYRCIAPDVPGFGESFRPTEQGNIPLYGQAIWEALQGLGIEECWLLGAHSGTAVCVELETRHPGLARKLVLSGPVYSNDDMRTLIAEQARPFEIREDGSHLLEIWQRIRSKDAGAPLDWAETECINNLHAGPRWHEAYLATVTHDFNNLLPAVTCPTLMIAGDHDTLRSSLEPAQAALPGSQMQVVPGATTYIMVREAPRVAAILRDFFREE